MPWGVDNRKEGEFTDVMDRLDRPQEEWDEVKRDVNLRGIEARVSAVFLPSGKDEEPLFALQIDPPGGKIKGVTTKTPSKGTPWHVSLDFVRPWDSQQKARIERVSRTYKGQLLKVEGTIRGAALFLDKQGLGADRDVLALHEDGWWGTSAPEWRRRAIHISL